jgi:glycosyltransferase involved in cell wall biosynthesis
MIKILHIIVGLEVGGAEMMLKRLIESHHGAPDYQHSVISLTSLGKIGVLLQNLGIDVYCLNMQSSLGVPGVLWQLTKLIRELRPDIVQTWMYHADLLGGLAARFAGTKRIIWGIRTTEIKSGGSRATLIIRKVCAWLSYCVPHTIVCAAEASRLAHITAGYDRSRMLVVANGVDTDHLVATPDQRISIRTECGFGPGIVVIGCVGRFHPVKDHQNFIQAAGIVAKKNENAYFLLIGRGLNSENTQLTEWIRLTEYPDRFVLLGERTDIPSLLAAMDIFCLHSRTEGFPNVVGEAMAMSKPCVATDVGDAAMLIADTGIVVPKENFVALAQGLMQMIELQPAVRNNLGKKAQARIYDEFTMKCARERFEKIYKNVLK